MLSMLGSSEQRRNADLSLSEPVRVLSPSAKLLPVVAV